MTTGLDRSSALLAVCRTIRDHGYHTSRMSEALGYADRQGWETQAQLLTLIMSFLMFTPEQLATGVRWNGVWPWQ